MAIERASRIELLEHNLRSHAGVFTSVKVKWGLMNIYAVLLRGINVGGKNIVPMAALRACLEGLGFSDVATYMASGNVLLVSDKPGDSFRASSIKAGSFRGSA